MRSTTVCDSNRKSDGNSGIRANSHSDDGNSNDYKADRAYAIVQANRRPFINPDNGCARGGYAQANQGPAAVADQAADRVG